MAPRECDRCHEQIPDTVRRCPRCRARVRRRRNAGPGKWYEKTSVTLCVAAGLTVIGVGFIHVIVGVTSPYQLPFDIVPRDSFGYRETLVNARTIQTLPYQAAMHKHPIGVRVLQKRGYLPVGLEFEASMAIVQREDLERWQMQFDQSLGQSETRWQDRLREERTATGDTDDARACNARGVTLARQGEYQGAIAEFTRAMRRDPTNADAFYNRAMVYVAIGNSGAAASDLGKVIEIRPDFVEGHISRARLHAAMNQHDQAIAGLTELIRIDPRCVQAYFQRSLVFYTRGEYGKARDDVRRIQDLGSQAPSGFVEALRAASGGR